MAISFPSNPSIGDEYTAAGKTWTWNGSQWEGVPATSGIPYGTNAGRPANPGLGQPYFNADEARLEMYTTATGWQNIVQETPSVVSISGTYYEGNPSNTITINGTNFAAGAIAYAIGTDDVEIQADTTAVVSVVELSVTFSGLTPANEPYDIKVVNPSNLYGILYDTLQIDDIPVFLTQSGTLGTYIEESPMSVQVSAIDDESSNLIFSIISGSLPTGLSLNSATGEISGIPSDIIPNITYSFTVSVTDGNNSASRNFSITINDRGPVWQTSQTLSSFSKDIAYSQLVEAVDDNLQVVSYSLVAGSLPTGFAINSSTGEISGTTSLDTEATFTIRATDTNSGAYSDRQFTIPNTGPAWQTPQTFAVYTDSNSIQLSAIDDSGIDPVYSLLSGSLPSGMSLSSSGLLTGASGESENYQTTFTVRATDNNGKISDREFTVTTYLPPFIDWGGAEPSWQTSVSESYNISNIEDHYSMGTDSFNRYLIIGPRVAGTYDIYIPIYSGTTNPATNSFTVTHPGTPTNSYGNFTDTVRGVHYHQQYGDTNLHRYLVPNLAVSSGEVFTSLYNSPSNQSQSSDGALSIGFNNNDAAFHEYNQDTGVDYLWIAGRAGQQIRRHAFDTNTNEFSTSYDSFTLLNPPNSDSIYGMSKDRTSGHWVIAHRNSALTIYDSNFNYIKTITPVNTGFSNSIEDVVVDWSGDIWIFASGANTSGIDIARLERTA